MHIGEIKTLAIKNGHCIHTYFRGVHYYFTMGGGGGGMKLTTHKICPGTVSQAADISLYCHG